MTDTLLPKIHMSEDGIQQNGLGIRVENVKWVRIPNPEIRIIKL